MRGRSLVGVALAAGAAVAVLRRRGGTRRERVDVYFADGSMVTLDAGADADRLLGAAREALAAARG